MLLRSIGKIIGTELKQMNFPLVLIYVYLILVLMLVLDALQSTYNG